ncbi:hypothetical protein AXF42_Ash001809 [Apostasia shenzhenica]|uniref:Uncharacterized protein n=1 Tax=Apostasia shenzhenica TaxID=1088818 RepID=A0A2I0AB99_9ASPA|nr:hypothetical protein AXF42_Ash001809 [Apostasia shenzhenica]
MSNSNLGTSVANEFSARKSNGRRFFNHFMIVIHGKYFDLHFFFKSLIQSERIFVFVFSLTAENEFFPAWH